MLKSGGVVILMQLNLNKVKFLIGNPEIVNKMTSNKSFVPFDKTIIDFLNLNYIQILLHSLFGVEKHQ